MNKTVFVEHKPFHRRLARKRFKKQVSGKCIMTRILKDSGEHELAEADLNWWANFFGL